MLHKSMLLVIALALTSCQTTRATRYIVTGQTIDTVGQQFIAAAPVMMKLHVEGKLSDESYAKWQAFAVKFKATYHLAVSIYGAAVDAQDMTMLEQTVSMVGHLGQELQSFVEAFIKEAPDAGI